jgi:hypothetical protein
LSIDGLKGVGDPGGNCKNCPLARFGSDLKPDGSRGNGQACKDVRQVLLLLQGEILSRLPYLLNVPPASVKNFERYMYSLTCSAIPYWYAVNEISLEGVQSMGGIDYARIQFRLKDRVKEEEQNVVARYHMRMKELLVPALIDGTAYEVEDEGSDGIVSAPRNWQPNSDPDVPF